MSDPSDPNDRASVKNITIGGVHISGGSVQAVGDIVGTKNVYGLTQIEEIFRPLVEAVRSAPPEHRQEAEQKVAELKGEVAKGKAADDSVMAKITHAIVRLAPDAVAALAMMFGQSLLSTLAGPATKAVVEKLLKGL